MSGTNRSFLLDTNAVIANLAGDAKLNNLLQPSTIFIASIVLGELYAGAEKSARVQANIEQIDKIAARGIVLACDQETAWWYGRIMQQLRVKRRPIPQNDIWIAAIALQHDLTLVTRDEHFRQVDGLQIETW